MENQERDFVTFADEAGVEFELEIVDSFDYEDDEYSLLADTRDGHEEDFYIMKIVLNEGYEQFVSPDESIMDALMEIVQERFGGCGRNCAGCESDCGSEE